LAEGVVCGEDAAAEAIGRQEAGMTTTRKKRPRDPVQLGKLIVEIATGQTPDSEDDGKNAS
jgi:hypothetical protein